MPGLESLFWRGIRLQRRRGEEQYFLGSEKFLGVGAPETMHHRQGKPRQAKGSLRGQMTYSVSGWYLAEAVNISIGDHVRARIVLGLHHICPRHGSSAVDFFFRK